MSPESLLRAAGWFFVIRREELPTCRWTKLRRSAPAREVNCTSTSIQTTGRVRWSGLSGSERLAIRGDISRAMTLSSWKIPMVTSSVWFKLRRLGLQGNKSKLAHHWQMSERISNFSPSSRAWDPMSPRSAFEPPPLDLERRIAERWKAWVPWVRMHLLRARQSDPSVDAAVDGSEFRRLRRRHSQHILNMLRARISMRTIRRHRLDDPRLANEVRAVLVAAARERQSKARFRRSEEEREQDRLATLIKLGPIVRRAATAGPDCESHEAGSHPGNVVLDRSAVPAAIQSIRRQVCEHFYLREMRDPELKARNHRRAYVLPRQIAMYIARQLTGASLAEIGCQFGDRHYTTTLNAIRKIEAMRRTDEALNRTITRLVDPLSSRAEDR
jgi:hypothetical protein